MALHLTTIDKCIELLEYLIRPVDGRDTYDINIPISLKYLPKVLDGHMTRYLINMLHKNRSNLQYEEDVGFQFVKIAYQYAYSKQHCSYQYINQPRATWHRIDGANYSEVSYYHSQALSHNWYINSPKYYTYPYHTTIRIHPILQEAEKIHAKKIQNLRNIPLVEQRQSYLIYMRITERYDEDIKPRPFTPYMMDQRDAERTLSRTTSANNSSVNATNTRGKYFLQMLSV